jgi:hypothetical protein
MTRKGIVILSVLGLFAFIGIIYIGSAFSFRGSCVRVEEKLKAQLESNKSSLATHVNIVREMVQVPEMYRDDLVKVIEAEMSGRYAGEQKGGSPTVKFVQEHSQSFDSSLYTKIQTAIEAGRTRFHGDQQQLMDIKREYETLLNGNQALFVNMWFNFPHVNLNDFKVIINQETERAYVTGKSEALQLRPTAAKQ